MSEEKNIDEKKVDDIAEKIGKSVFEKLGLDKISERLDGIEKAAKEKSQESVLKVFVAEDTKKDVSELTKDEVVKAFAFALATGDEVSIKALSEGTNADGGFTVPQDFRAVLIEEIREINQMRSLVTVLPMKRNVLTLVSGDHGPETYWTSEGATKTTTTMDFAQPTLTAYKLASIIYLTDELIDDSAFDLVNVIIRRYAEELAAKEEQAIIAGTGVGQPTGIFVNATVATRTCNGNLDFDDMIDLEYDLPKRYRRNARFIVHNTNVKELRKIKDGNGRYLWQDAIAPGQPATFHGYPVIETYDCPESQIAFGDYKVGYYLGDRQKMTVKVTNDTETTFTQDKTAVRVVMRIAGDVIVTNAIRKLITIP